MKVTIVDYGIGNLLSVKRAFIKSGAEVAMASNAAEIGRAEKLVVPGVGAFHRCMQAIDQHGIRQALIDFASTGRPYMGICVGMQMLMNKSNEFGDHSGLGLIPGEVTKIKVPGERVPFIGWKKVMVENKQSQFYFVHSYQAVPFNESDIYATYQLGEERIVAMVKKENIIGVQFHPEKSAEDGLTLINNFINQNA